MDIDARVALASLDQVKEYLDVDADEDESDEIIQTLINGASAWIAAYLKRDLVKRENVEFYSGDGGDCLALKRYPITAIASVHVDNNRQFSALYLVDANPYFAKKQAGILEAFQLLGNWAEGSGNIRVRYTAGYDIEEESEEDGGLPQSIRLALYRIVDKQYRAGFTQRKLDIASEMIGDRTTTFRDDAIPKDVKSMLDPFRKHLPAHQFEYEEAAS